MSFYIDGLKGRGAGVSLRLAIPVGKPGLKEVSQLGLVLNPALVKFDQILSKFITKNTNNFYTNKYH
jgi:hypothetical protein